MAEYEVNIEGESRIRMLNQLNCEKSAYLKYAEIKLGLLDGPLTNLYKKLTHDLLVSAGFLRHFSKQSPKQSYKS